MKSALAHLSSQFDVAARAGTVREVWWRDDDATCPGPRLDRLFSLASAHGAPLALAAIPAGTTPELLRWCETHKVSVLQHGIAHENHETVGKSAELGAARPVDRLVDALLAIRDRLVCDTFLPVVVPPWNRMRADLAPALSEAGYGGVSLYGGSRDEGPPVRVDSHIDPIDWRGARSLAPSDALLDMARRAARVRGPIGLLTHHIVHDDAIDRFVTAFAALVHRHEGARWVSAPEAFGAPA